MGHWILTDDAGDVIVTCKSEQHADDLLDRGGDFDGLTKAFQND